MVLVHIELGETYHFAKRGGRRCICLLFKVSQHLFYTFCPLSIYTYSIFTLSQTGLIHQSNHKIKRRIPGPNPSIIPCAHKSEKMESQITLPPGTYWIGDLSYVFGELGEDTGVLYGYQGLIQLKSRPSFHFVTFGTGGDGTFLDERGQEYPVDSASIGLINVNLLAHDTVQKMLDGGSGHVHEFILPFTCDRSDEIVRFGDVIIFIAED